MPNTLTLLLLDTNRDKLVKTMTISGLKQTQNLAELKSLLSSLFFIKSN